MSATRCPPPGTPGHCRGRGQPIGHRGQQDGGGLDVALIQPQLGQAGGRLDAVTDAAGGLRAEHLQDGLLCFGPPTGQARARPIGVLERLIDDRQRLIRLAKPQ